jgi:ribulose bisphosphate carboxylase small subunit
MEMLKISVEIPIINRGRTVPENKPMSDEEIAEQVSYVLNVYLQDYCRYVGAPKFGKNISANGIVNNEGIGEGP